ncbi:MAG: hypothetical protein V4731_01900 [Pseudomonadota bacterium]
MTALEFARHTLWELLMDESGRSLIEYVLLGSLAVTVLLLVMLAVTKIS